MANDQNKDEMINQEKEVSPSSAENVGEPKKKKITAVFRKQNSVQNSLKSRPSGNAPQKRKPAPKDGEKEGQKRQPRVNKTEEEKVVVAEKKETVKPENKNLLPTSE